MAHDRPAFNPMITGLLEHVGEMAVALQGSSVVHVNSAFEKRTGFRLAEVRGLHPAMLLGNNGSRHLAEEMLAAAERGQPWSADCGVSTKPGTDLPVKLVLLSSGNQPLSDLAVLVAVSSSGNGILDHDRRLRTVGQYTGEVAHSLNNQLTVIQAHVAAALEAEDRIGRPELEKLAEATNRAESLVAELLLFSRRSNSRREVVATVPLLLRLVNDVRSILPNSITVDAVIAEVSGSVRTEPGCIEQVVLNLATNARDALPRGGRVVIESDPIHLDDTTEFTTGALRGGDYLAIRVKDNGGGMEPETLRQVFTPFFTTKPAGLGTGLGLPTVRDLVLGSGGQVQIDTSPAGTCVSVILPRIP